MASLVVSAEQTRIGDSIDFIMMQAKQTSFSNTELADIRLGCEEFLVNIVKYAYGGKAGTIEILCETDTQGNRLTVTFRDTGIPFNPLMQQEPDISGHVGSRRIGGLGIYLTRQVMDSVTYDRENGTNVNTLTKR